MTFVIKTEVWNNIFDFIIPSSGEEVDCAHTFFRWLFLHGKKGLEVPNSVTLPVSLWTHNFWIDIEDVGTFNLPHSSYIHKPPTIRVEVGYSYDGYCHHYADSWNCYNLPSKFNPNIVTHS